ncbi:MAG TPA: hypothetical protein VK550_13555 [Polyangiaceae bacterium]|nr:hypothetical protein [Polyangiaceae bacterium]
MPGEVSPDSPKNPKSLRQRAGVAVHVVAARAGVAIGTVRSYELDPENGVSPPKKAALDPVYEGFAR